MASNYANLYLVPISFWMLTSPWTSYKPTKLKEMLVVSHLALQTCILFCCVSDKSVSPAPLQNVSGICCITFGNFCQGFSWRRIFVGTFPTKMRKIRRLNPRKNPAVARKSAEKSGGPKEKIREKSFCQKPTLKKGALLFLPCSRKNAVARLLKPDGCSNGCESLQSTCLQGLDMLRQKGDIDNFCLHLWQL